MKVADPAILLMMYLKICVSSKTKDVNVKAFNVMTRINEAKTMAKHGSCDCKYKLNSVTCDSNQNWNNKTCQYECRNYRACKKDLVGILLHVFMRIAST